MSANRDKTQRFTFVYNNLYQIYQKERAPSTEPALQKPMAQSPEIQPYQAPDIIGKRIESKKIRQEASARATVEFKPFSSSPVESLKTNLKVLSDIHGRLHFMLKELEELAADGNGKGDTE